jgi:cytochrome P450
MSVQTPFELFTPAFLVNPYSFYDRLRTEEPVRLYEPTGGWVLTRYDHIDAIPREPRWSANRVAPFIGRRSVAIPKELQPLIAVLTKQFLFLDSRDHTRLRGLVSKAFTPRVIKCTRAHCRSHA